jgi:poly(3-hydroxybutyrate) depolymerase
MTGLRVFLALSLGMTLTAQTAPPPDLSPAKQPDLQTLSTATRSLRRTATVADEVKAKVDKLLTEAQGLQASGQTAEAHRRVAQAYALLKGQTWDPKQEFAWSLALRPDTVADSSLPFIARLTQTYSAPSTATAGLNLKASLIHDGKVARELGVYPITSRDLNEQPFGFDADLDGVADGEYILRADLLDGDAPITTIDATIQIVRGIAADRAAIEKRLAKIQGHDGTKASIRYPYVLAETVNVGRRQLSGADFGLPYQPQPVYDFAAGVKTSADLLKALEAGKDPLYRAKGNSERAYWFEEAREMMAYHVYAPLKWDGKSKLPMVLVLHGNTRDQDYYFDRDDHILAKMAEEHGYLVVCPMGYRPSAGWGSNSLNRPPAGVAPAPGRGGFAPDPNRAKQGEYSEKDALNVLDIVMKEYPVDPARVYLFGHSAGGAGTWYFGEKYADKWAGIAASAAATTPNGFPFDRLKGIPLMVCHGDKDDEVPVARSRNMVAAAKEHGLDPQYLEVPGATHLTIVALIEPKVFAFFDQHPRKN